MLNRKRIRWLLRELTRPLWHEELVRLNQLEAERQMQGYQQWVMPDITPASDAVKTQTPFTQCGICGQWAGWHLPQCYWAHDVDLPPHPIHVDPRALHPYRGPIHVDPHAWPNEWQVRQKLGPGLSV